MLEELAYLAGFIHNHKMPTAYNLKVRFFIWQNPVIGSLDQNCVFKSYWVLPRSHFVNAPGQECIVGIVDDGSQKISFGFLGRSKKPKRKVVHFFKPFDW